MTPDQSRTPQITVLDAGGQYCHLIARKVRELGIYAEVKPSETPVSELAGRRGLIISGGPSSVYEPGSPTVDAGIFQTGQAVLGICYGHQLMAHLLGGDVRKGDKGEFGMATLEIAASDSLLAGIASRQQIWMSHRDRVAGVPDGFSIVASTATCPVAAMVAPSRKLYGIQFHPEVNHTRQGKDLLRNFLYAICGCHPDWDPSHRIPQLEDEIRRVVGGRSVFFFVSGGVDSTVAYTLCLRALGTDRVRGVYVDTGLMREGETEFVARTFADLGSGTVTVERAAGQFLGKLAGARDPEQKRHIIGEEFLLVQERIIESMGLLDGHWVLGQGTIYPDTIESGGTEKAATIKTHHNRVAGVQELIAAGRIVEPIASLYKDEVRAVGRELGLPHELLDRHPFPGPGLAIRCLCASEDAPVTQAPAGWLLPVRSVGVQGDSRSYAPALALDGFPGEDGRLQSEATELINRIPGVNRVVAVAASKAPVAALRAQACTLSPERLDRLRRADAVVRRFCQDTGFDKKVWQFPVVLIPLGCGASPDSVVLRPVDSVDGMTAQSVSMDEAGLRTLAAGLLTIPGVCAVFYDLTHKPPATIEWE